MICEGVVALVVILLLLSSSRRCCPHCNDVILIINVIAIIACLQASNAAVDAQAFFAGVTMAIVALVTMASSPLLMRRRVSTVVELVLLPLPLVVELVSSPTLRWGCCHQCAGFLPLLLLQFCPNDNGIVAVVNAQTSLLLLRWCHHPRNNGIVALDPQRPCCPHCNGIIAVLKLASLPCFHCRRLHK